MGNSSWKLRYYLELLPPCRFIYFRQKEDYLIEYIMKYEKAAGQKVCEKRLIEEG